jgi:MFS family permease
MAKVKETNASKWFVLFSSLIIMTLTMGFNFTSTAILLPTWQEEFGFSDGQYGLLAGAISLGGMVIVFIAGSFYDKLNLKMVTYTMTLVNGVVIMLRYFVDSFGSAYLMLFLGGLTANFTYVGLIKAIPAWFDKKWLMRANGILTSGASLGFFLGYNLTPPLATAFGGWRGVFILQGAIVLVVGLICFAVIPSRSEAQGAMNQALKVQTEGYTFGKRIKELLTSKQVVLVLISEFFISGCILSLASVGPKALAGYWDPQYYVSIGIALSMVNVGSLVGYYTVTPLGDKVGYRKFCIPFVPFSLICFAFVLLSGKPSIAIIFNLLGGLGDCLGIMCGRVLMLEHPTVAGVKAGTATGLLLTLSKGGGVVFPLIFTGVAGATGSVVTAWLAMLGVGVLGIIPLLFTQDTGPKAIARRKAKEEANKPATE